jgi:hypothetical protein
MKQNVLMKKRGIESWTEFKDRGFISWRRPRQQKPGDSRRAILKKTDTYDCMLAFWKHRKNVRKKQNMLTMLDYHTRDGSKLPSVLLHQKQNDFLP